MKVEMMLGVVWIIALTFPGSAISWLDHDLSFESPFIAFDETDSDSEYRRLDEVEKECGFAISEACELKIGKKMPSVLTNRDLDIWNGDWMQEKSSAPLMPFISLNRKKNSLNDSGLQFPPKLASFRIMNVGNFSKKTVNVKGRLQLGVLQRWNLPYPLHGLPSLFEISLGQSFILMKFEGIYTETEQRGGEHMLCMLGNGILPGRSSDPFDPWTWLNNSISNKRYVAPHFRDDKLMLVLRYPSSFSLTRGAIRGNLKSLNKVHSLKYFDEVFISSWQSNYVRYHFGSEYYVSRECALYPYQDMSKVNGFEAYKGNKFCDHFQWINRGSFNVVPNWNCKNPDYCNKLGPFISVEEITRMNGSFQNVKLAMQSLRCKPRIHGNASIARVSAMFRVILPSHNPHSAAERSGLNGMTLAAEGMWSSIDRLLCMVGCLQHVKASGDGCNVHICIYLPASFSIKQRSILTGTISSTDSMTGQYYPLSFEKVLRRADQWSNSYIGEFQKFYQYSKISLARSFREKNQNTFSFADLIKKTLFKYISKGGDEVLSMHPLMEDLSLRTTAVPIPLPNSHLERTTIELQVLSMGYLYGNYSSVDSFAPVSCPDAKTKINTSQLTEDEQRLINVSADLTLFGTSYRDISSLFLEGLYDPVLGTMHLIGCRDMRALSDISETQDLEDGFDCLIEVKVEYPRCRFWWLVCRLAKVSIASQRNEDDPLYFQEEKLQTFPIRRRSEDMLSLKGIKLILSVLTLFMMIGWILSHLFCVTSRVPFVSLVMLVFQAIGYGLLLSNDAEALLAWVQSDPYESYNQRGHDYVLQILVLAKFLVTLRHYQKAWKSLYHIQLQRPIKSEDVLSDMQVLRLGFWVTLVVHIYTTGQHVDFAGAFHKDIKLERKIRAYLGLVDEFFFLPQMFRILFWQIYGRTLSKFCYIGFICVRLLPHIYDYITAPMFNPYVSKRVEFVNHTVDFNRKVEGAIAGTTIILAVIVVSQKLKAGQKMFLRLGSRVYRRLVHNILWMKCSIL